MEQTSKTLQFKTNIHCGGCVAKVSPFLNNTQGIVYWEVDTAHADKILTVQADSSLSPSDVMARVQEAGFQIHNIQNDYTENRDC